MARTGITSGAWLQTYLPATQLAAGSVVISLGVNDDPSMDTAGNLRRLRSSLRASVVTWLLPGMKEDVRRHVRDVARQFGDRVVDTTSEVGPDHLHPSRDGYRVIAAWTVPNGTTPAPPAPSSSRPVYVLAPQLQPMLAPLRPGTLPSVQVPSLYGAWPPLAATYAAIPPRDYAYRAIPALPRR